MLVRSWTPTRKAFQKEVNSTHLPLNLGRDSFGRWKRVSVVWEGSGKFADNVPLSEWSFLLYFINLRNVVG
ncbi:unnamed protein product [Meloidogyne enterolobii]|uniref:Uncharacterized protein n=1 Tax=Meloidogyne enterolobii TaxID=390850 RepID=A0ACB0ZCV4_MELEN